MAKTVDISLWVNEEKDYGIASHHHDEPVLSPWTKHSISYQHNRLWKGDPQFLFDKKVNDTTKWETLSYTALLVTVGSLASMNSTLTSMSDPHHLMCVLCCVLCVQGPRSGAIVYNH